MVISRKSSMWSRMACRNCRMHRTRNSVSVDHSVVSNACRAAPMARSISPRSALAAVPSTSSVAGSTVGKSPADPGTNSPAMNRSLLRSAAIAIRAPV